MSRWGFRGVPAGLLAAATLIAACVELSGPQDDLSSVTPIAAAWPSVVVGDLLRDIAGNEAPLHLDVYDGDGNVVTDATVTFVVLDTGISVDGQGYVLGLNRRDTPARIVAQARRGNDVIQTPEITIDVVSRPDSVQPAKDTIYAAKAVPVTDAAPIPLDSLKVRVLSRARGTPEGVKSWLVRYEILDEPAGFEGRRTVLYSDGGTPSAKVSFDTTDENGLASRTLVLQRVALAEQGRQNVLVLVTVGNSRGVGQPTMFFITLPLDVE